MGTPAPTTTTTATTTVTTTGTRTTTTTSTVTHAPAPAPTPNRFPELIGRGCCRRLPKGIVNGWKKGIIMSWTDHTWNQCMQSCAENASCAAFAVSGCSSSSDRICGGGCHLYEMSTSEDITSSMCYETNGFAGITDTTFCYAMP